MDDSISRQAAIDAIDRMDIPEDMCVFEILSHIELEIGTLPSVQPKRGEWIMAETAYEDVVAKCSICGFETLVNEPGNGLHYVDDLHFCPFCGADMRGGEDG